MCLDLTSNDIASVYPRRDALVRDILVDIGDEVKVGETLALLFNPGVGGEGQSKIKIKDTIVSSKYSLLKEVKKVKEAQILELDQKINEKEIILQETINNFDSKISLIGDFNTLGSEYQVQLKSLENLQKNLLNAEKSKDELLNDSHNNINQKEKLLEAKMEEIYSKLIPILYIGNERELVYGEINSYDFSDMFGAKDSFLKGNLVTKLKNYEKEKSTIEINENYNDLLEIRDLLLKVLQNTIISVTTSESIIQSHISSINSYKISLIAQQEILDDAKNMYKLLTVSQKEKIDNIDTKIIKKETEIALLGSKSHTTESEKSLSVGKMKAEIETLITSRDLLIAKEDKNITILENEITIAQADLNSEYIKSGDYKIISPFSGIISKRGIEIGEKISSNKEAFRLTQVSTTLSKITKKEVRFYVPENIKDNIEMGKEITFSLGDNNQSSFTGTIYRISPEIDEQNFSITVQARVDESIKMPNKSTLRVSLKTQEELYKVPSSSIYNKEERKIIYYKKDNGKLGVRDINIVSDDGEYSLITGNIDDTLKIVTTPIFIK